MMPIFNRIILILLLYGPKSLYACQNLPNYLSWKDLDWNYITSENNLSFKLDNELYSCGGTTKLELLRADNSTDCLSSTKVDGYVETLFGSFHLPSPQEQFFMRLNICYGDGNCTSMCTESSKMFQDCDIDVEYSHKDISSGKTISNDCQLEVRVTLPKEKFCKNISFYINEGSECSNFTTPILPEDSHCEQESCSLTTNTSMLQTNSSYCIIIRSLHEDCQCNYQPAIISCYSHHFPFWVLRYMRHDISIAAVLAMLLLIFLLAYGLKRLRSKSDAILLEEPRAFKKAPPRSLTQDDLEHISRLPSQKIVLVYFPDTVKFKELNIKLRDWLRTLDVKEVKDIYEEKFSEDVLRAPDEWVRNALGGPENRIILVCSRLAYECLITVHKGIASPKFVETDPHFGLLTRVIRYLEKEMRGNYRNLICVRYEDLKICSRKYSSEAFDIVPGTEYVLPQHLEDIYRWVHPKNPRPECWSDSRPEVKDLLRTIREYRIHDENIFTVQFPTSNGYTS